MKNICRFFDRTEDDKIYLKEPATEDIFFKKRSFTSLRMTEEDGFFASFRITLGIVFRESS